MVFFVNKMEKFVNVKKSFCGLCLSLINSGNFKIIEETVREVLDILQLKLNVEQTKEPLICDTCSGKLFAAFKFKATCMDTEDCIFPYVNSKRWVPVDLREVYLKERRKEHLKEILEDERICRLCMQVAVYGFTPVDEIDVDRLRVYIPEVHFSSTADSVICKVCVESLNLHTDFLMRCLNVQGKIENVGNSTAAECLSYIKQEDVEIKPEIVEIKPEIVEIKHEDNNRDVSLEISGNGFVNCSNENDQQSSLDPSRRNKYKCDICGYEGYKLALSLHQLKHKENPELPIYRCKKCNYKTQRKGNFKRHEMTHKDLSEVPVFKCSTCDFQTKMKKNLERHQLTHKDISQTPTYRCDICGMETIHKCNFKKHQAIHKDSSQVRMYKCDQCDFETKHKSSFGFHRLRHKNSHELETYKCEKCDYVTTQKHNLSVHKQKHKEFAKYMCDTCGYQSKTKGHLVRHMLVHKDFTEENLYRCSTCDFATVHKSYLKEHEIIHKDVSEVQVYGCDKCGFKTRHRGVLTRHRLTRKCLKRTVIQA